MKKLYVFFLLALCANAIFAQSIFDNPINFTNPNTANPFTAGQTVDPNITVSGIGRGTGIAGSNATNRYNANGWTSPALDANDYFEFVLTPNPGISISYISLVFTTQVSNVALPNFALRSSIDGFTTDIGTVTAGTSATLNTIDLSGAQYQNLSGATTFRVYAWGADLATRTFSINDFTFNGVTGVLPVSLEYFSGSKLSNGLSLNWKANCSGTGSAAFVIERSNDGRNFKAVNSFTASAVRCLQPFEFTDNSAAAGKNFYRIKVTEDNGKSFYSNIISLLNASEGFDMTALLPTLVKNSAVLSVSAAKKTQLTVVITDYMGRRVQQQVYSLAAGSNQLTVNAAGLAAGVYTITGITSAMEKAALRFVKE
jgi:hypothetical protein